MSLAILREESHHESYHNFLMKNSKVNQHTEFLISRLDAFCDADTYMHPDSTLIVGGFKGCGKSSVVAHWVESRRLANAEDEFIIYHHAQASQEASKISSALERWIWLMGRFMRVGGDHDEIDSLIEGTTSEALLMQRFSRFCTMVAQGYRGSSGAGGYNGFSGQSSKNVSSISEKPSDKQRLILVVDGVDQMLLEDGSQSLRWLPAKLPKNVTVILTLTMHGPLQEQKDRAHKKIEIPKHFLKLPSNLKEALCFHVNRLNMFHRPEVKGIRQNTFSECWRRKSFFLELKGMDLGEQRDFILNFLQLRSEQYKEVTEREPRLQSVLARPSYRHSKIRHEIGKLCSEAGPTSNPLILSLLLQAASIARAEEVQENVNRLFSIVSESWENNKNLLSNPIKDKLFVAFIDLLEKSFHHGCRKFRLEHLTKKCYPRFASDPNQATTIFRCAVGLMGSSRFGLQPVELWTCLDMLNPDWGTSDIVHVRAFLLWLIQHQSLKVQYYHRDPDASIADLGGGGSPGEKNDEQNSALEEATKTLFGKGFGGISLFQAMKLKKISKRVKEYNQNLPWWYRPTVAGKTSWSQELYTFTPSSDLWTTFRLGKEQADIINACHCMMATFFRQYDANKQRVIEEVTVHGIVAQNWVFLKRFTTQILWFLHFWRSEGGVNRRDLVRLWCSDQQNLFSGSSALEHRFDIIKEFIHATDVWWEKVRLSKNGDDDAADKNTTMIMKDICRFFNACIMLYHNRFNDENILVPEFHRNEIIEEQELSRLLILEVNETMTLSLSVRRRGSSVTSPAEALHEMRNAFTPKSPTSNHRATLRAEYDFDSEGQYSGHAARYAIWLKRWHWIQIPYSLVVKAVDFARTFKHTQHQLEEERREAQLALSGNRTGMLPQVSPMKSRTKPSMSKKKRSTTKKTNAQSELPESNEEFAEEKVDIIDQISKQLSKGGSGKVITERDLTKNPLDVLRLGQFGAADESERLVRLLQEAVVKKQEELSRHKLRVSSLIKKLRSVVDTSKELELVEQGAVIDTSTGKFVNPGLIHCQKKMEEMTDRNLVQDWKREFYLKVLSMCEHNRPDNNDYIENAGDHVRRLTNQIQDGSRNLAALKIENDTLKNETLPAYRKELAKFQALSKKTLGKIEEGVDEIYRKKDKQMERMKKKQQLIKDMEAARAAQSRQELQDKQTKQTLKALGLGLPSALNKEGIKKALKKANLPKLIRKLEAGGIEDPSEILPKLLAQGRSLSQMERDGRELSKKKENSIKKLAELKRKLHELEFGDVGELDVSKTGGMSLDMALGGRNQRRVSMKMGQNHMIALQTQLAEENEQKLKKMSSRKQELLNFETKISSTESKAKSIRERLILDISYLHQLEQGLMHLAMIVDSREAKETLLEDPNSGSDASLSSGSDDDSDAPLVRKQTNEFREKSNSGFRASMRGKRALKHIYSKILKLKEQTKEAKDKKRRNVRRSVITGEILRKNTEPRVSKKKKNGEKLSKSLEREYYEDGMPKPLRPVSRLVVFRRKTIDDFGMSLEPTGSNTEDEWWKEAQFSGGANVARRKLQERVQREKDRKERARLEKIRLRQLEIDRQEAAERERLEAIKREEEEQRRIGRENERKLKEEEERKKKRRKRRRKSTVKRGFNSSSRRKQRTQSSLT